ncbi:MAG: hypothetical protein ACK4R6_11770 [Spirosomataceae bacterium]
MIHRLYTRLAILIALLSIASFSTQAQVTVLTSTTHLPRNVAEPVFFTAYGCDGQVVWLNFLQQPIGTSNVSQDTPGFQGRNTYFVKCGNAAPQVFFIDKTRTERSVTPIISADKTTINAGESVTLTAPNCPGVITWMSGNFVLSNASSYVATPTTSTTYTALCTESTKSVSLPSQERVTIRVANPSLPAPIINTRDLTGVVQIGRATELGAFNCFYTVNWLKNGDRIGSGTTITVTAAANDVYTATCTNEDVVSPASNAITTPGVLPTIQNELMNRTVCLNGSTTFQIQATGATGFQWQFNNQNITGANSSSYTISQVTEAQVGSYRVIVSNASGSVTSNSASLGVFSPIVLSTSSTSATCTRGTDGTATVSASSGTAPYTYRWSNGATTASISGLSSGVYSVTVTDANGCTATSSVTVSQLTVTISVETSAKSVTCFQGTNGTASALASNGTAPYTFAWSNGATTAEISGLSAGNYTVTVTDANGCTGSGTVSVSQPELPMALEMSSTPVSCFGGTNGTATALASRGTAPYTFAWSNGAIGSAISNLAIGNFTVIATDANGCTATNNVTVSQPSQVIATTSNQPVLCHGTNSGSALVNASGGTSPYSFRWSNGFTGTNPTGLSAGLYTVTITDGNGCTTTVSSTITQPQPLVYSFAKEDVKCFGGNDGKIELSPSGGTAPYQLVANGVALPISSQTFRAGSYQISVRDVHNCFSPVNTVQIQQPAAPVTAQLVEAKSPRGFGLKDGSISVEIKGGTGSFGNYGVTWTWDGGAITNEAKAEVGGALRTTLTQTGGGNYQLRVTDTQFASALSKEGCTTTLNYFLAQPEKITAITAVDKSVSCFGKFDGQLSANVKGGVIIDAANPYKYEWFKRENNALINLNETSNKLINVDAGRYVLRVVDKNDIVENFEVELKVTPSLVTSVVAKENPTCVTSKDGFIEVRTVGGVAPLTVDWGSGLTGARIQNLQAGNYFGVVRDREGCTGEIAVALSPKEDVKVRVLKKTDLICRDVCAGAIELEVTGNTSPFKIEWAQNLFGAGLDNGTQANIQNLIGSGLTNLCAGEYGATVTTELGCKASVSSIVLANPEATTINVSDNLVVCSDANLELDAARIVPSQSYTWTFPSGQKSTSALAPIRENGNYTLEVVDAKGCKVSDTFSVQVVNVTSGLLFTVASEGKVNEPMFAINLTPTGVTTNWRISGPANVTRQENGVLVFTPTGVGTVRIELATSTGGCSSNILRTVEIKDGTIAATKDTETDIEEVFTSSSSALAEKVTENSFIIYPNPTSGSFFVKMEELRVENASIRVLESTMYRQVYAEDFKEIDERGVPINLESYRLKEGNYYLIIMINNQRFVKRLHIRETLN